MTTAQFIAKTYGTFSDRERRCSSVYTDHVGNVYSYGPHYPLLFKVGGINFVNTTGYSNTTAKHIGWAWSAIGYGNGIAVELNGKRYPEDFTLEDMKTLLSNQRDSIANQMRSKKRKDTQVYKMLFQDLNRLDGAIATVSEAM